MIDGENEGVVQFQLVRAPWVHLITDAPSSIRKGCFGVLYC